MRTTAIFPNDRGSHSSPSPSSSSSSRSMQPTSTKAASGPILQKDMSWILGLPDSPYMDYTKVKGNLSLEEKRLNVNVITFFMDSISGTNWGASTTGRQLRFMELNLREDGNGQQQSEVVLEIRVSKDMVNVFDTLHGACGAWLVDLCSSAPLVSLGIHNRTDSTGVSQAMNLIYHGAAPLGMDLRIVATSITNEGKIRASRCEIRDKKTNKLIISAIHTKVGSGSRASKL